LSDSCVDSFVKRNEHFLCTKEALPIDDLRTEVSIEIIDENICTLIDCSLGVDPSLFINIDETGYTDVSSLYSYSAIIPREYDTNPCHFKIDRNQKNITTIASITLDGDTLIPSIVIPSESIPTELDRSGFRDGKDGLVLTSSSGYVNSDIFFTYFMNIVVSYIRNTRNEKELYDYPALILMDNCHSHVSENIRLICAEENIRIVTYPPHTSHLFQPLDLLIFALFKRKKYVSEGYKSFNITIQRIAQMMNQIRMVCTPDNVRSSFRRAGIFIDYSITPHRIEINLDVIRKNYEGQASNDMVSFEGQGPRQTRKRRKSIFGYINNGEAYLLRKSICPHCFQIVDSDDEYDGEE